MCFSQRGLQDFHRTEIWYLTHVMEFLFFIFPGSPLMPCQNLQHNKPLRTYEDMHYQGITLIQWQQQLLWVNLRSKAKSCSTTVSGCDSCLYQYKQIINFWALFWFKKNGWHIFVMSYWLPIVNHHYLLFHLFYCLISND